LDVIEKELYGFGLVKIPGIRYHGIDIRKKVSHILIELEIGPIASSVNQRTDTGPFQ
jgi:hypothetical protein